jgi:hypothetical protein
MPKAFLVRLDSPARPDQPEPLCRARYVVSRLCAAFCAEPAYALSRVCIEPAYVLSRLAAVYLRSAVRGTPMCGGRYICWAAYMRSPYVLSRSSGARPEPLMY